MNSEKFAVRLIGSILVCLFAAISALAQTAPQTLNAVRTGISKASAALAGLPDQQQRVLSSGARNLLQLARGWKEVEAAVKQAPTGDVRVTSSVAAAAAPPIGFTPVTNPGTDFLFSIMAGFTQSETSTAWCGKQVVVGFNDSGSLFESLLFGGGGESGSGVSVSNDGGHSFRDAGFVNPGGNPNNLLLGDPVVSCALEPSSGPRQVAFYYSQIMLTGDPSAPLSTVAVSRSVDGGATWADPTVVAQKDVPAHFLDNPWHAVDAGHPNFLFATYTDFDMSGAVCGFSSGLPVERTAIELVRSTDGGATWSSPKVIAEACNAMPDAGFVQGSQIAVDGAGRVLVAWEAFAGEFATKRALFMRISTDHGQSFGKAIKISDVIPAGDGNGLQGGIRNNEFPMLAIDPSRGGRSGILYVAWNDGRSFPVRDAEAGFYGYSDILVSRSTDAGATWDPPVRVNDDPIFHIFLGVPRGTDHFQPGIAVDRSGAVAVCWYDRRSDPANFRVGRACAVSNDTGLTWTGNGPFGDWAPWHAVDVFIDPSYLGDYDTLAADSLKVNSGFQGAFAFVNSGFVPTPNQDVVMFHIE
jgi:hypothetical protein